MDNLYKRIADLCQSKGVSAYRLCKDIGIQPSIITDLKMGRQSGLSAVNAEKISSYFGVSVSHLLGTETKKAPAPAGDFTDAERELIMRFRRLNQRGKDFLMDCLETAEQAYTGDNGIAAGKAAV